MYSNILLPVPYDPQNQLEAPLAVAKVLASEGAKVTLVHVFELLPNYVVEYLPPNQIDITKGQIQAKMDEVVADLSNAEALVLEGHAGRSLSDYANEHGTDLIVMTSHQPELSDLVLGSTAGYVVRHVNCAVHVLR